MGNRSKSQKKADKNYEPTRVQLCHAKGTREEFEAFRDACSEAGYTQREAINYLIGILKNSVA